MTDNPTAHAVRTVADYDMDSAYRDNDRHDLTATLLAAGFQAATLNKVMLATSPGFAVRSDVALSEQAGIHLMKISIEHRHAQDHDIERDDETIRAWALAVEKAGGWEVDYTPGLAGPISVLRRAD